MNFYKTLSVLCLMTLSNPLYATNFYAGLNLGVADQVGEFEIIDETLNPGVGITGPKDYAMADETSTTGSLFFGYKLSSDMAIEIGVASNQALESESRLLSATESADEKFESNYMYAALVGVWPIQGGWAVNGRLGVAIWNMDYTQTVTDATVANPTASDIIRTETLSDSASATLVGLGISYGLTSTVELKFGVETHLLDYAFTNVNLSADSTIVNLGMAYHF